MLDTTIYNTVQDEMITRAPHFEADGQTHTETYKEDRAKVWELLMEICGTRMDCWTYIECRQPNQDGRAGFLGLYNNYLLGPNKVDNQAAKAEAKLLNTTYAGEKKRWNFDKYVQVHISQFTVLQSLEQYGYKGIDARTRVCFLMAGIKMKDLDPVTTRIMSSPKLKLDFDSCSHEPIPQLHPKPDRPGGVNPALNITRVSTGDAGAEDVEDRYYTRAVYNKLTPDQKLALKRRREARGDGDTSGNNKGKHFKRKKMDVVKEVRKLAAVIAQL